MRRVINHLVVIILFSSAGAWAQNQAVVEQSATYASDLDRALTVKKVAVLPVTDNIEGIYARAMEARLTEELRKSHRWDLVETKIAGSVLTPSDLEASPEQVKKLSEGSGADALFAMRASRGPNGVTIVLDMFLVSDGMLILQEVVRDYPQYESKEVLSQVSSMYAKLVAKMPYSGIVLSRQNNRVTINLGKQDGISANSIVTAILLVKAERHPKFNFLISTEREVLGKIKIEKVDETICFGIVISEKARGAITRQSKITGIDMVNYDDNQTFLSGKDDGFDPDSESNKLAFGKGAQEWIPAPPPTFGKVGIMMGLGSYLYNHNLETTGNLKAQSSIYPSIRLDAELWLTSNWNVLASVRQGVLSATNPRSGSTPKDLNISLSRYALYAAYNFLLKGDFFGPKIQVLAGFSRYNAFIDSSAPLGLTSTSYNGFSLGLRGELPLSDEGLWTIGAGLEFFLRTTLNESPGSSGGDNKSTINSFQLFGSRKLSSRIRANGMLDFEQYSTSFSGDGSRGERASSSSQRLTTLFGGIEYLF